MKMVAVLVDELPAECNKCIFRPAEDIGWIGHVVEYCVLLEKPMALGARRLDCPLKVEESKDAS